MKNPDYVFQASEYDVGHPYHEAAPRKTLGVDPEGGLYRYFEDAMGNPAWDHQHHNEATGQALARELARLAQRVADCQEVVRAMKAELPEEG